jgi:hypothetical protein
VFTGVGKVLLSAIGLVAHAKAAYLGAQATYRAEPFLASFPPIYP